jgi:hypothetical protein
MLDTVSVRSQIAEARKAREGYIRQAAALEATITKLDAYIGAAEALLAHVPAAQGSFTLGEAAVSPTLRGIVKTVMTEHRGIHLTEESVYDLALEHGAEARPSREKGVEAVKYALYDLRKKDPSFTHLGEGTWLYTPF